VWVGIGGYTRTNSDFPGKLLQTGTTDQCVGGIQKDSGWWEMYPSSPNFSINFTSFLVSPGDSMAAYVFQLAEGFWETRIDNLTTGLSGVMVTHQGWGVGETDATSLSFRYQGFTPALTFPGGYTAEWIVENYSTGRGLAPFANFGSVSFSELRTSLPSWSLVSSGWLQLVQSGVTLSAPTDVTSDGFTVRYTKP
jgi:hypothetical protein